MAEPQRVAVVTAAGSGIGAACARALAARGDAVVLMSRSSAARALADELGGVGLEGSVLETADLERLVETALDAHGRIDAVVNNTGHAPGSTTPSGAAFDREGEGRLLDLEDADWHATLDVYMLNVVRMARLVTPVMQRQGGGAVVNVSAFAAFEPSYAFPASVMRAALAGFVKLYADRYARDGIRMNNVLPGYLDNHAWRDDVIAAIPAGRPGRLDEIAATVAFLLSDEAGYVTGQNLVADGGLNRSV